MTSKLRVSRNVPAGLLIITVILRLTGLPVVTGGSIRMDSGRMLYPPGKRKT